MREYIAEWDIFTYEERLAELEWPHIGRPEVGHGMVHLPHTWISTMSGNVECPRHDLGAVARQPPWRTGGRCARRGGRTAARDPRTALPVAATGAPTARQPHRGCAPEGGSVTQEAARISEETRAALVDLLPDRLDTRAHRWHGWRCRRGRPCAPG